MEDVAISRLKQKKKAMEEERRDDSFKARLTATSLKISGGSQTAHSRAKRGSSDNESDANETNEVNEEGGGRGEGNRKGEGENEGRDRKDGEKEDGREEGEIDAQRRFGRQVKSSRQRAINQGLLRGDVSRRSITKLSESRSLLKVPSRRDT